MMSTRSNTPRRQAFLFLAISIALNTLAFVAIKMAVDQISTGATVPTVSTIVSILAKPYFWIGGFSFLASMYFWVLCLKLLDLSTAYPTSSVSYVLIAVVSFYLFGEEMGLSRLIGIALIVGGVSILYVPDLLRGKRAS